MRNSVRCVVPMARVLDSWRVANVSRYQDSDNNTILTLLADFKPPVTSPYRATSNDHYTSGAALRMAKLYHDRYPYIRDWANAQGKTALHAASMRGNEEIVRVRYSPCMLCKSCPGDPDRVHLNDRCYVPSRLTLTCPTTKGTLPCISEYSTPSRCSRATC